ncbi:ComF family protein [Microcella humidisoli]|uniref:ComF family protein n=1 Tax=Microcella humidisoli TaxID=2963406 RepID=A0ABY5FU83_9MICO|nr:phosphoribosyltransferase family protein [Microcella humidisoli]UTT61672.1 ComF family protein [Microcella humidisoli]
MVDTRSLIGAALAEAWALIAPVYCAGCGAPDRALCAACAPALRSRLRCAPLESSSRSALPVGPPVLAPLTVVAALPYAGVVRATLLGLKHEGRTELARSLAAPLRDAVTAAWSGSGAELLVPVPGSRAGAARRGFAPVALIARRAGLAVVPALRAASSASEQKGLSLDERLAIDEGRWRASDRVQGRRVLLVDDVVTSGATLRAAARALRAAGAEVAGAAAIAATPRRRGVSSIPWRFMADDD